MELLRRLRRQHDEPRSGDDSGAAELVIRRAASRPRPQVAILSDDGASDLAAEIRARLRKATVVDLPTSMDAWERHVRFVEDGPFDVVVDHTLNHDERLAQLQDLHFLARPGGVMIIRDGMTSLTGREDAPFKAQLELLKAGHRGETRRPTRRRDPLWDSIRLGKAIASFDVEGEHLVFTRARMLALAKLDEAAMNLHLERTGRLAEVITSVPAEQFRSRCALTFNAARRPVRQPEVYDVPELSLRVHHDAVVAPGQVVVKDGWVLPESYRHNLHDRLRNRQVIDLAPRFGRPRYDQSSVGALPGTYFHLDSEFRGHFGHLLTEQVSRLWAWPEVKATHPDAKVLMGTNRRRPEMMEYEYVFYEAAGIAREDIVLTKEPVCVERLYGATPMMENPSYVHPGLGGIWRAVGDALARDSAEREWPERIFLSRHVDAKRACNNQSEVEDLFRAQGFEVLLPETFSLPDQVQLFRKAEVIAGFAGSGLFNIALVDSPKRVISIGSERYHAANEYQMASVQGHRMAQITCRPDHPDDFHSPYTFDHEREGPWLAEVFSSLS
ncbi:hypothetical protein ASG90_10020 [Nocardioides sp. Soil797]|nr:hypothetical protein ASG90_10020 [Nocardioides sp. Soil797]